MWWIIVILVLFVLLRPFRIIKEYERGVKYCFGKYVGIMNPGFNFFIPIVNSYTNIDIRMTVVDVPTQDCITKDNISVKLNAVLYFFVKKPQDAVNNVEDYYYAVSELAQTTMKNVVGEVTLNELLSNRDEISKKIEEIVDIASNPWGIDVYSVDLKDTILPKELIRSMAKEAESERERRALIIIANAEKVASENIKNAAKLLNSADGALHLRTLQELTDISSDGSNTVVFTVPVDGIDAYEDKKKR
jgi:regulator of protease activity HflC (stomatin/prohibitin superfamily)